jgi:phosphoribosyl 1,2-cyclic phosphodiesterase
VIRFSLLGSGSSGNALLVASPRAKILIDNGLSFKQLQYRAAQVGVALDDLKAVFITHEHSDHVQGLGVLARKLDVPVYMTSGTHDALPASVGKLPRVELFEPGDEIAIDGLTVNSFSVSHDAADPVSYVVHCGGARLGLAADLGHVSQLVISRLMGAHALILESNYCPNMLRLGGYPATLQQRIRGRMGHLSNGDAGALLATLLHHALRIVVLVHISEENNRPSLAVEAAAKVLRSLPVKISVAQKHRPTELFEVTP